MGRRPSKKDLTKRRVKPSKVKRASPPKIRKGGVTAFLKELVPLSIPIKVAMLTGTVYISALIISTVVLSIFEVSGSASVMGIPLKAFFWGVNIFLVAVAATVSTHLFLDKPLSSLTRVMGRAEKGDFLVRAPEAGDDELGDLSRNFNKMLSHLTDLSATKIETEHELFYAQRELKFKTKLAEQNKLIEKSNKTLEALVKDLSLLYEIGQGVNSTIELEELYRVITDVLQQRLGLDKFAILVKDETGEFLNVRAAYGFDGDDHITDMTFRAGEGVTGEAMSTGEAIYIRDTTREDRFLHYKGERIVEGAFLAVPLIFKKETLGVINFHRPEADSFSEEELRLLKLVANQIALAIENAKLYTKARDLSVKDELTGLYNRRHFQTVLQIEWKRAVRFHRNLSLLMVDVDFFKKYNDTFGHLQGDKVLREMGATLRRNIREIDTVARFGGEEFIVLLPDTDKKGALAVGEKLRRIVESHRFLDTGGTSIQPITISVGVSSYPDDVRELDDLIDHADIALYDAKDSGRNRVISYPQLSMATSLEGARNLKRPVLDS